MSRARLAELLLLAYIDAVDHCGPAVLPLTPRTLPARRVDPDRGPYVPLRADRGDIAPAQSGDVLDGLWWGQ